MPGVSEIEFSGLYSVKLGEVDCCHAAILLLFNLKAYLLSFGQCAKAGPLNSADMNENVLAAVVWRNEPIAFGLIKPLYGALRHRLAAFLLWAERLFTACALAVGHASFCIRAPLPLTVAKRPWQSFSPLPDAQYPPLSRFATPANLYAVSALCRNVVSGRFFPAVTQPDIGKPGVLGTIRFTGQYLGIAKPKARLAGVSDRPTAHVRARAAIRKPCRRRGLGRRG